MSPLCTLYQSMKSNKKRCAWWHENCLLFLLSCVCVCVFVLFAVTAATAIAVTSRGARWLRSPAFQQVASELVDVLRWVR